MRRKGSARLAALVGGAASLALASPAYATTDPAAVHRVDQSVAGTEGHGIHLLHSSKNGDQSTNWAGYAAHSGTYTSVSSSWTQPTLHCSSRTTYSSFWVGLDGYGDSALEQTGTEADCVKGQAVYGAWWEVLPSAEQSYPGARISGGDHITASVSYGGRGTFTMTLTDSTAGWTKRTTHQGSPGYKNTSAEVIAEATNVGGGVGALSDFGTVAFDGSRAGGSALPGSAEEITMVGGTTGRVIAQPSRISGGTFSVSWKGYN